MNEGLNHRHWPDQGTRRGALSFLSLQSGFDAIWCCYVQGIPKSLRCQPFGLMCQWSDFVLNTVSVVVPTHWKDLTFNVQKVYLAELFNGGWVLFFWDENPSCSSPGFRDDLLVPCHFHVFPQDFQNIWSVLVDTIRYAVRAWCRCRSCLFHCLLHLTQLRRTDIKLMLWWWYWRDVRGDNDRFIFFLISIDGSQMLFNLVFWCFQESTLLLCEYAFHKLKRVFVEIGSGFFFLLPAHP